MIGSSAIPTMGPTSSISLTSILYVPKLNVNIPVTSLIMSLTLRESNHASILEASSSNKHGPLPSSIDQSYGLIAVTCALATFTKTPSYCSAVSESSESSVVVNTTGNGSAFPADSTFTESTKITVLLSHLKCQSAL